MLNEHQIKALKNGAYGVTRDGGKVKFIANTINGFYTWAFYDNNGNIVDVINDYLYFSRYLGKDSHEYDIVGLWQDKPEPFDLEKALEGAPVLLRNGEKAFVMFNLDELPCANRKRKYPLNGYLFSTGQVMSWTKTGGFSVNFHDSNKDIVGMWKDPEPQPQPQVAQLPKPIYKINDNQEFLYRIGIADYYVVVKIPTKQANITFLDAGFYYSSKEEVIKIIEAITGKPYQDR